MFLNLLPILFLSLAAMFKAIADTLRDHYDISIFRWKDPKFWKPEISWKYADTLRFTNYHLDGWHLANSGMIISFVLFAIFHHLSDYHLKWYFEVLIAGGLFNVIFNMFYNKILRK